MTRGAETEALSSEQLALQAQGGCDAAFEELARRHAEPLRRFLRRKVRNAGEAEDLAQETLIRAHQRLDSFQPRFRFTAWLFTIGARLAYSRHRRMGAAEAATVPLDEAGELPAAAAVEEAGHLWATAARVLRASQHEALWLRYGEELTVAEIAERTGRTRIHVKVLLHRARLRMAEHLRAHPGDRRGE